MNLFVALTLALMACSGETAEPDYTGDASGPAEDAAPSGPEDVDDPVADAAPSDAGPGEEDHDSDSPPSGVDAEVPEPDTTGPPPAEDVEVMPPEEIPWLDDPVWQCENGVPVSAIVDVVLPANDAGCPWNQGDNLNLIQGAFAAHQVTVETAELPGPSAAICHVDLDSASFDTDYAQPFIYDDHFLLAFNDVVLLSSYGDIVGAMPADRNLYLFDWNSMAGAAMNFNNNSAFCLGYGTEDTVDCTIPAPESNGLVAYSVGGALGVALSARAVQEQRIEFMLVTFGDNDAESDCRNSELRMQVVVDYVIAP